MSSKKSFDIRSIIYAAVCIALCMALPFLSGGRRFSLMQLPVLLCGFISGPVWGLIVGVVAPLLRCFFFGAFRLYPDGLRTVAELGIYGLSAGLFYRYLPRKPFGIYVSLLSAQFFGRLTWGVVSFAISLIDKNHPFFIEMVMSQTISPSLPGLGIQLLLIPPVVYAMQKAKYISR